METLQNILHTLLVDDKIAVWLRAGALVVIGLPLIFAGAKALSVFVSTHHSRQYGMVAGKVVKYAGIVLVAFTILREFGFSLAPLLGAAGIIGVALGFASQTSVSNLISGLFLIAEAPFEVG
ncbi:MAG: mechanosensitive ion channel, partial [Verrucomicrobiae bacterium]|nr:mechanosensitive ion channel [Verrucomicrobiae bacterium]